MVELFTQCDAEYGRRLSEALSKADNSMQKGPIGSITAEAGVQEAEETSHAARPY